ncbi:MAG: ATP phosphoribosyltransferase regulatory subunit [Alphaproteobacteria bacterium]|nr:ATP phosphoribosyltransferase regulatory subunit [Alphaproteobacteria bacterium]
MNDEPENRALLPAGLHDLLPPHAAHEAAASARLLATFAACGYQQVKPPLVEFETTLIGAGGNGTLAEGMFRVMDPVSRRMMAVRDDMTLQVARIAQYRLSRAPRPLRLSYSGEVLSVHASQLRPERQVAQAGVELIGSDAVAADIELLLLATTALAAVGVSDPTIDLNSPALVARVLAGTGLARAEVRELREALDRKDAARVRAICGSEAPTAKLLAHLVVEAGPAERVLATLASLNMPAGAAAEVARLAEVVAGVRRTAPDLSLTVDPVEYRGFEYQTGVSFTIFATGVRGELGRGGRYVTEGGEPATGFTLYLDSILRAVPSPAPMRRIFLPAGTPVAAATALRADGWATIANLDAVADAVAEARRLGCGHIWRDGAARPVASSGEQGR